MNYPKINMFLLIVVIIGLAVALYFLFINKKDTNAQSEILIAFARKFNGDISPSRGGSPDKSGQGEEQTATTEPEEPAEPTDEDWKQIYAISEKIYFNKPRTKKEQDFQKKFDAYIQKDIEFCNEFYPIVDLLAFPEKYNSTELSEEQQAFYEANKEQVDAEVEHRKYGVKSSESGVNTKPQTPNSELTKANPPVNIEERNKKILALFEDGIPKSIPQIKPLYIKATGNDPGKNLYRIFGKMEGKFLTPYKKGNITYYCLPEWFEGKKLKQEFKDKIIP